MAEFLGGDKSKIVTEWMSFIFEDRSLDDARCLKLVKSKFNCFFDAAVVASAAVRCGRRNLALEIAKLETSPAKLVSVFLEMGLWNQAIKAATDSSDTSLFLDVLKKIVSQSGAIADEVSLDMCSYSIVAKIVNKVKDHPFAPLLRKTTMWLVTLPMQLRELQPKERLFPEHLKTVAEDCERANEKLHLSWLTHQCGLLKLLIQRIGAVEKQGLPSGDLSEKTINETIQYIAGINPDGIKCALAFGRKMNFSDARVIAVICDEWRRKRIRGHEWDRFMHFSDVAYKDHWSMVCAILYYSAGKAEALKFASRLGEKKDGLIQQIESGNLGLGTFF
jgi:hypothetical protein